jgi:AraC-like DNA-binding protein
MIVKDRLKESGIKFSISPHDAIEFHYEPSLEELDDIDHNLKKSGLELLNKENSLLIDRIINTIHELIHDSPKLPDLSFEEVITENLLTDGNNQILKIFSDVKGISIVQYIIQQKIERIKELILYQDKSLSEIAHRLRYRNKDTMIAQFQKHTGLTPAYFMKLKDKRSRNVP